MFTGDIPQKWEFDKVESDNSLSSEGDVLVFHHTDSSLTCTVEGVKEVSDRLDFLGQIVVDGEDDELESLWLSSEDYPTVSHTRDEILDWAIGQMEAYDDY